MSNFRNNVISKDVAAAIVVADKLLLRSSAMMADIYVKNDWKYDSGSGPDVIESLLADKEPVPVFTYKSLNPWTSALGYSDGKAIYLNIRKLGAMSHNDLVGLLLHELAHYKGFSHGNNFKTEDKVLYSVPYWLSSNVEKYL
jgi:hypothetical protein